MKAAVLHKTGGPFQIEEVDLLPPEPGEVRVRLVAAGVCHSDWHMVTGHLSRPFPVVLGHEGAGIVEEVGRDVRSVRRGDHVILNWSPSCDRCFYCSRQQHNLCETFVEGRRGGTMRDGTTRLRLNGEVVHQFSTVSTFAEYTIAPEESCIVIADDIPLDVASLLSCAVTTGVGAALNTVHMHPGDSAVVFGCGGVGLNVLQGARLSGAYPIIAVDTAQAKMDIARQFGATHTVLSGSDNGEEVLQQIRALTAGRGADFAFEAIGLPSVQEQALKSIRPGGALVVVGVAPRGSHTRYEGLDLHVREKRIYGSLYGSCNTRREFPRLLELYRSGQLLLDELISGRYALSQINDAYVDLLNGDARRGVIVFDGDSH